MTTNERVEVLPVDRQCTDAIFSRLNPEARSQGMRDYLDETLARQRLSSQSLPVEVREATEVLQRELLDLDAASIPTKSEVYLICGGKARQVHRAIETVLAALASPQPPRDEMALRPMSEAPKNATWVVLWFCKSVMPAAWNVEPVVAHWADGDGDGLMPPYKGWFQSTGGYGFSGVDTKNAFGWSASLIGKNDLQTAIDQFRASLAPVPLEGE